MRIPRDAARPKLEDLIAWQDEVPTLPFQPEEEALLERIVNTAQDFRNHIAPFCNPVMATADESETQRFYLRKIEGAEILLAYETNFFRQELHKWSPVAPEAPPILQASKSTRKPRPTKLQKLMAQHGVDSPEALPQELKTKPHQFKPRKSSDSGGTPGQPCHENGRTDSISSSHQGNRSTSSTPAAHDFQTHGEMVDGNEDPAHAVSANQYGYPGPPFSDSPSKTQEAFGSHAFFAPNVSTAMESTSPIRPNAVGTMFNTPGIGSGMAPYGRIDPQLGMMASHLQEAFDTVDEDVLNGDAPQLVGFFGPGPGLDARKSINGDTHQRRASNALSDTIDEVVGIEDMDIEGIGPMGRIGGVVTCAEGNGEQTQWGGGDEIEMFFDPC